MASRAQIAMIHTLKSKIGMADDAYRAVLEGFGVSSSKDLSGTDAKECIQTLMRLVPSGVLRPRPDAPSRLVASYAQQAYIRGLWDKVSRVEGKEERARALNSFIEKRFRVSHIKWLPRGDVGKVIHTLEAMQKQTAKI